jgi:hypothetical protein
VRDLPSGVLGTGVRDLEKGWNMIGTIHGGSLGLRRVTVWTLGQNEPVRGSAANLLSLKGYWVYTQKREANVTVP